MQTNQQPYAFKGKCFQAFKKAFAIAEAQSAYTLYVSISCPSLDDAVREWEDAEGEVPAGWKAYSSEIPANTIHAVEAPTDSAIFYMQGLQDESVTLR